MTTTRTEDRQATKRAVAKTVAHGTRLKRARSGVRFWEITETVPGTFRVVTTSGGDYAVQYYPEADRWTCDCEDFILGQAHHFGIPCKHICGVRDCSPDLVDPETGIPLSLGQGLGENDTDLPDHSRKEDTMNEHTNNGVAIHTIPGLTWQQVRDLMTAVLPTEAYKAVPGGADLTDINPAYLTEVLDKAFGPCGYGWWFEYGDVAVQNSGQGKMAWHAAIDRLEFRYRLVVDGELVISEPILANGGSNNSTHEYAVRGAITNALGGAASKLLWQIYVYKGLLSHRNVAAYHRKKAEAGSEPSDNGKEPKAQSGSKPSDDSKEPKAEQPPSSTNGKATSEQVASIRSLLGALGYQASDYGNALQQAGFAPFDKLTADQADQAIERLEAARAKKDQPAPIDEVKKTYIKGLLATLGHETDEAQDKALAQAGFPALDELTADQAEPLIERLEAAKEKAVPAGNGRQ